MTDNSYQPQAIYTKEVSDDNKVVKKSAMSKKNLLVVLGLTSFIVLVMAAIFLSFSKRSTAPTKPKADITKEATCSLSFVVAGSPSPTPTVSPTPGVSPSPTPSVSPTPGVTPSPTPSVSPTPGVSPSPSPSPQPGCNESCTTNSQCTDRNSNWICSSTYGNVCRLASYPSSDVCLPPAPSPSPYRGCNDTCVNNSDCSAYNLICYYGRCRLDAYPDSDRCVIPSTITQQVVQQQTTEKGGQPEMPAELPKTGVFDMKVLGAGAALTIIGAMILLIL